MSYLGWLLKALVFFTLFAFALNNQHETQLNWFFGLQWHAPTVLIVLAVFALGLVTGALARAPWQRAKNNTPAPARPPLSEQHDGL